jgi:hypothetical protein
VLPRGRDTVDAIECKWRAETFETRNLRASRDLYPRGRNLVVSPVEGPYERRLDNLKLTFVPPDHIALA